MTNHKIEGFIIFEIGVNLLIWVLEIKINVNAKVLAFDLLKGNSSPTNRLFLNSRLGAIEKII